MNIEIVSYFYPYVQLVSRGCSHFSSWPGYLGHTVAMGIVCREGETLLSFLKSHCGPTFINGLICDQLVKIHS